MARSGRCIDEYSNPEWLHPPLSKKAIKKWDYGETTNLYETMDLDADASEL